MLTTMERKAIRRGGSTADALLDAAEKRVRAGGYHGFSFRNLAADVGIKSASVHHHFSTKEDLVCALVRRYADRFLADISNAPMGWTRVITYRAAFRRSLSGSCRMCLCGVLSAESAELPDSVVTEAQAFFRRAIANLADGLEGITQDPETSAMSIFAQLEGAALLART